MLTQKGWKPVLVVLLTVFGFSAFSSEPYPHLAEFRLAAGDTLPEVESAQQVIFTDAVSGIPDGEGIHRITAPPLAVVLGQRLDIRDASTGESCLTSEPVVVWEPGTGIVSRSGKDVSWVVRQVALYEPQGFVLSIEIQNSSATSRQFVLTSTQRPSVTRPQNWNWDPTFRRDSPALAATEGSFIVHDNAAGAVALALAGATATADGESSTLTRRFEIAANAVEHLHLAIVVAENRATAFASARRVMEAPERAASESRARMDHNLEEWFERVPVLIHPDPRVVRFYRRAAAQLLWARWRLGKSLALDPWYSTSGRDSGALNAYAWDLQYAAQAVALLDPDAMRALLVALPAAPLTQHFSIEPLKGAGLGPFYAYNSYAYTAAVDEYLRRTGDWSLLSARSGGKTVLEWLVELAQWGERDRDTDGNGLLDCGKDKNILELKKTGTGPGYINEVPSPNGERAWVYDTVAGYLQQVSLVASTELISRFRERAETVRRALNGILWMDEAGWYGSRQRDGSIVPVYSIQVFDLLRFPGLVPRDRAQRIVSHLNKDEFLGPWGVRSMSIKDRLFDYNDHDWAGPMSYAGDGPQLVADLYGAGFDREASDALERILWWPEHMAVYPQGIANDDYSLRYPVARKFGGRISAGRSNVIAGATGIEAILRGLFGVQPGLDGSIAFSDHHKPGDGPYELRYPFRGHLWTATQTDNGLKLGSDRGLDLETTRAKSTLRVAAGDKRIAVQASARDAGSGQVRVGLKGVMQALGVGSAKGLSIQLDGKQQQPPSGPQLVIAFSGSTLDIEFSAVTKR